MSDDREELLAEAYRRGILPDDVREAYEEAAKRQIVPPPDEGGGWGAGDTLAAVKGAQWGGWGLSKVPAVGRALPMLGPLTGFPAAGVYMGVENLYDQTHSHPPQTGGEIAKSQRGGKSPQQLIRESDWPPVPEQFKSGIDDTPMPRPDAPSGSDQIVLPPVTGLTNRFINPPKMREALDVVKSGAQHVAEMPQRAFEASEAHREGYGYDPGPMMDAAMLAMAGGLPMAEKGALGIFGGRMAATADKAALAEAEKMAAQGVDRKVIWDATGWFQGADKKWRFEIPDQQMTAGFGKGTGVSGPQSMIQHPELAEAYPDLLGLKHRIEPAARGSGENAGDRIVVKGPARGDPDPRGNTVRNVAAHEMQHSVQDIEGFALGSNSEAMKSKARAELIKQIGQNPLTPTQQRRLDVLYEKARRKDGLNAEESLEYSELSWQTNPLSAISEDRVEKMSHNLYRRTSGEVEARNVQKRVDWTDEQRRATPPWESEDVERAMQLLGKGVRKDDTPKGIPYNELRKRGTQASEPPSDGFTAISKTIEKMGEKGNAWVEVPEGQIYMRASERPNIGRTLELGDIEFHEEARGKGAFKTYLKMIEGEARERGFDAVYVEQLFNKRLEQFLRKSGYKNEPSGLDRSSAIFAGRISDQATLYKPVQGYRTFVADESYRLTDGTIPVADSIEQNAAFALEGANNRHDKAIQEINEHLRFMSKNDGEPEKIERWEKTLDLLKQWKKDKVSVVGEHLTESEMDARFAANKPTEEPTPPKPKKKSEPTLEEIAEEFAQRVHGISRREDVGKARTY